MLEVSKKTELQELLYYYRSGIQCARTLCYLSNLRLSHSKCKSKFQTRSQPVLLPDFRSVQQVGFPLTERVAPTEIRRFLQAGSVLAYTRLLADKAGAVNKDCADGYMAREIMTMGLTLAALLDELYHYPMIFSNGVERLVRRLVVHEKALDLGKKERGAYCEKNLAYLARATSGKSLKQLA